MSYFLTVCLNPTLQKTIFIDNLKENSINRSREYYLTASGKGINVSRVLGQLGHDVVHITHAGGTMEQFFLSVCSQDCFQVETVRSDSEIRFCYTLINTNLNTTTEIVEEPESVSKNTEDQIKSLYLHHLARCHTVIISGTKAAGYSDDLFPWMAQEAGKCKRPIILDYRGQDLIDSLPFRPTFIKPNLEELEHTIQLKPQLYKGSLEKTLLFLSEEYKTVPIITNGSKEILFIEHNKIANEKSIPTTPVNTTGCGDSFTAGFASALFYKKSLREMVQEGNRCGWLNAKSKLPGWIL